MDLGEQFDRISKRMRIDFEEARASTAHAASKGSAFEDVFRKFLCKYLPKSLDISSGFVMDSSGKMSRQLDVIVSDSSKTPIFFESDSFRVVPIECVYAVFEVKAMLNSQALDDILLNMKSVRCLTKTAFVKEQGAIMHTFHLYGKEWSIWPVLYFVFALDSMDLFDVASQINRLHARDHLPEHQRIDSVCVLDKGLICNQSTDGFYDSLPSQGSILNVDQHGQELLKFFVLMSMYLNQASMPFFNIKPYTSRALR